MIGNNRRLERLKREAKLYGFLLVPEDTMEALSEKMAATSQAMTAIHEKYQETHDLLVELLLLMDGPDGSVKEQVRQMLSNYLQGGGEVGPSQ